MDIVIVKRLYFAAEKHGLLPAIYTSGRVVSLTEYVIYILLEKIYVG